MAKHSFTETHTSSTGSSTSFGLDGKIHTKGNESYSTTRVYTKSNSYSDGMIVRMLASLIFICLLVNVFISMQGGGTGNQFSFEKLLSVFEDMNDNVAYKTIITFRFNQITDDWSFFNFFRDFLNRMAGAVNALLFILGGVATLMTFFIYISQYVFLF